MFELIESLEDFVRDSFGHSGRIGCGSGGDRYGSSADVEVVSEDGGVGEEGLVMQVDHAEGRVVWSHSGAPREEDGPYKRKKGQGDWDEGERQRMNAQFDCFAYFPELGGDVLPFTGESEDFWARSF